MKNCRPLLFILVIVSLTACKKGSNFPIVGKWQQVKLRTYTQSYSGAISNDTSYLSPSFNNGNYAQFNNDGTCVIGIFYPPGSINLMSSIAYPSTRTYNYAPAGAKYVLTTPPPVTINPGGFGETDTASVSGNMLLIHQVFDGHIAYQVSDAYYTK